MVPSRLNYSLDGWSRQTLQASEKIAKLIENGVLIPHPASVDIGMEVLPSRIAPGAVLFPGTRIYGRTTLIGPASELGSEGPTTVVDCQLGSQVQLKGGFFKASVFLDRVSVGSGAQVREGCLLEEESGGNHTVGLKQTILFPFVTLGSLINFCDCLMAGGTDRRNHSEVGSSFIHFNYTPNQDKATPSLLGDVPRGVMMDPGAHFSRRPRGARRARSYRVRSCNTGRQRDPPGLPRGGAKSFPLRWRTARKKSLLPASIAISAAG